MSSLETLHRKLRSEQSPEKATDIRVLGKVVKQNRDDISHVLGMGEAEQAYALAEQGLQEHLEGMGKDFEVRSNGYREAAGLQPVKQEGKLMKIAEEVVQRQVTQGYLKHTSPEELKKKGFFGEILVSGFSSADEALKKFIKSPLGHYLVLMGDYEKFGYAISCGIDKHSGEKIYYLAVVYGKGEALKSRDDVKEPDSWEMKFPDMSDCKSLEEVLSRQPHLGPYFAALQKEGEETGAELKIEFSRELTAGLKGRKKKKGTFWVLLEKNGRKSPFLVSTCPPMLQEPDVENKKFSTVPFPEVLKVLDSEKYRKVSLRAKRRNPAEPALS